MTIDWTKPVRTCNSKSPVKVMYQSDEVKVVIFPMITTGYSVGYVTSTDPCAIYTIEPSTGKVSYSRIENTSTPDRYVIEYGQNGSYYVSTTVFHSYEKALTFVDYYPNSRIHRLEKVGVDD